MTAAMINIVLVILDVSDRWRLILLMDIRSVKLNSGIDGLFSFMII